jgi:hypothetical protein
MKTNRSRDSRCKSLTTKQRGLVRALSAGKSVTQAALEAGYSAKNPGQSGWQALQNVQRKMSELLDEHGLTDEVLIEKHLKPLLKASESKFFHVRGRIRATRRVPCLNTRIKALDMAFRLKGSYAAATEGKRSENHVRVIVVDVPRPPRRTTDAGSNISEVASAVVEPR